MIHSAFSVTAEFVAGNQWRVWHATGGSNLAGPVWPASLPAISRFADEICARTGGCTIRSIVFVAPGQCATGPIKVTTQPRHVWILSPGRALVSGMAHDSPVVVVDTATRSGSVHMGAAERLITDAEPERVAELMRALNITRLLVRRSAGTEELARRYSDRCSGLADVVPCWPESVRAGAQRFAASLVKGDGVWFTSGRTALMRCHREFAYSIHHTRHGAFDDRDSTFADVARGEPLLMVLDRNVDAIHGGAIRSYSRQHLNLRATVTVDGCEQAKSPDQVEAVCRAAAEAALPRNGLIAGVGGGVTLDIAGLAASLFRRGVGYVRVPTTLVGLVDVSVGIKHGVNAFGRKNILGTFFPPTASVNDYSLIRTSPLRSISCGMSEIVKIAIIRDEALLGTVEEHGRELLSSCCQLPAAIASSIVRQAEVLMMEELAPNLFESHLARLADFGHTFSPAIETSSHYRIAHGEAVALDMLISTGIAVAKGLCGGDLLRRMMRLFPRLNLPVWHEQLPDMKHLLCALGDVVAHRGGHLNLVVPRRPGAATFVQQVSAGELAAALHWMQSDAPPPHVDHQEHAHLASAGV